jgi:hypothetical protein
MSTSSSQTPDDAGAAPQSDTPTHTPDPAEDGPEPTGNPVDPAMATNTPDPEQTGRGER